MFLTPRLRKFALTVHVTSSVGWLGALACWLALAIAGLSSADAHMVRAAYLAMELTAWFVIVPLAFAALLSGIVQSLGTTWGLFQHHWVLAKLLLTVFATTILLLKLEPISGLADAAAQTALASDDLRGARMSMVAHAIGGLAVLLAAAALAVYKPRGMTGYGQSRSGTGADIAVADDNIRWKYAFGVFTFVLVLLFVMRHLAGGGHLH